MPRSFVVPYAAFAPPGLPRSGAAREAFRAESKGWVQDAKDSELAHGLDKDGRPFAALRPRTRMHRRSWTGHADPNAPPLQPAYGQSRTRFLLDVRSEREGVRVFWRTDPVSGKSWSDILQFHADGAGRLPVRDVFGLSPMSLAAVRSQANEWWRAYRRGGVAFTQAGRLQLAAAGPARIPLVGRIDLENAVGSIGASRELTTAAIRAGTFTGFRQFRAPAGRGGAPASPRVPGPRLSPAIARLVARAR